MLFRSKKILGIDIGSSSIKVAELEVSKKGATLVSFGIVPTPAESINSGEILNHTVLSEVIKSLVKELKIKRNHVAVNIWGPAVIVKRVTMPRIDANLVSEQIKWEAEQYIPFDINEISLDFHVLQTSVESSEAMEVLLVAAKKNFILNYVSTLEKAKLKCAVVDVSSFALANCFEKNYGKMNGAVALLNVGARITNFTVVNNGEIVFCRDVPVGGMNFTQDLHKEMGVSLDEAESLKMDYVAQREVPEEVGSILNSSIEIVADEIQNSFDFYAATASESEISQFYITGGGARLTGLVEKISENSEVKGLLLNPFSNIKHKKKFSPEYIEQIMSYSPIVLGLALRERDR